MRTRSRILGLGVAAILGWGSAGVARGQALPGVATADNMFFVGLVELSSVEPSAMRAAVQAAAPDAMLLVAPKIKRYEQVRLRLTALGVKRAGLTIGARTGVQAGRERALVLFELGPAQREKSIAEDVVKAAFGSRRAGAHQAWLADDWVVVTDGGPRPVVDIKPNERADMIQAAQKSFGARPGALVILGSSVFGGMKTVPLGLSEAYDAVSSAQWASALAEIDKKPAIEIRLQFADQQQAKQFAGNWPRVSKELQAFLHKQPELRGGLDAPPVAPMLKVFTLLPDLSFQQQGAQVQCALDTKSVGELIEIFVVAKERFLARHFANHGVTEELQALDAWRDVYLEEHGPTLNSLEELKPLLADTEVEQDAIYKRLLTHPRTREFPAYRYHKPAVDPQSDERVAARTLVLEELKGGMPDPEGYREFQDGHTEYKRPKKGE